MALKYSMTPKCHTKCQLEFSPNFPSEFPRHHFGPMLPSRLTAVFRNGSAAARTVKTPKGQGH